MINEHLGYGHVEPELMHILGTYTAQAGGRLFTLWPLVTELLRHN